ncbi:MAG TPA: OsmC family protein [Gemmatimonadaceae bacterium]
MKITLIAEDAIRLEPLPGPMTIEAESEDQLYSPFHMLGSGLAFCTYSVLASWASTAKLNSDDIVIEVRWTFVDDPHRIGNIDTSIQWPSLPAARQNAAQRVAHMCAIHATLSHLPTLNTTVTTAETAPVTAGV